MVPVGGWMATSQAQASVSSEAEGKAHGFLARRGGEARPPVVVALAVAQRLFPDQPGEARFFRQQVFLFEAAGAGEAEGAFAGQHDVVGLLHDEAGDFGGRLDVAEGGHGAGAARGAVHDAGVEFDHAFFVGQAAVADGVIFGIFLDDVDAGDHGVQRVAAAAGFHGALAGAQAVGAGDDDVSGGCHSHAAGAGQRRRGGHKRSAAQRDVVHEHFSFHRRWEINNTRCAAGAKQPHIMAYGAREPQKAVCHN